MRSRSTLVTVDLNRVRMAALRIRAATGVPLIAVIKADAYGLGARAVAEALDGAADELAYFDLVEAREVGKPGIILGPPEGDPAVFRALGCRPSVSSVQEAQRFAGLPIAVNLDTGMQRFGCERATLETLLDRFDVREVFTHTADPRGAAALADACRGRNVRIHAACTSMLGCADAWLDAVRPGIGLYRGAMRVAARLERIRQTDGPLGYTGFAHPRVGVILLGYAHGLARGPVLVNGRRQQILEVGMNTSYVSIDEHDEANDEVVLLGDGLTEADWSAARDMREHEVLCRFGAMGPRQYLPAARTMTVCEAGLCDATAPPEPIRAAAG